MRPVLALWIVVVEPLMVMPSPWIVVVEPLMVMMSPWIVVVEPPMVLLLLWIVVVEPLMVLALRVQLITDLSSVGSSWTSVRYGTGSNLSVRGILLSQLASETV